MLACSPLKEHLDMYILFLDNPESLRSCPVEDTMTALNKCPASPEEHPTSSETLKEDFQDLRMIESVRVTSLCHLMV